MINTSFFSVLRLISQKMTWCVDYATWFVCAVDKMVVWSLLSYIQIKISKSISVLIVDFGTLGNNCWYNKCTSTVVFRLDPVRFQKQDPDPEIIFPDSPHCYFRQLRYSSTQIGSYFLLGAFSPVFYVEGSRTRPGIIVVSRYLFFMSSFFSVVAFQLSFFTFAPCD
jgi:hypothetical protein